MKNCKLSFVQGLEHSPNVGSGNLFLIFVHENVIVPSNIHPDTY